jgi:hypothetical protein
MAETLATYTVPEHHVQLYTNNVRAALAKKGGNLRQLVSQGSYNGERSQVVNFLGPIFFKKRDTIYGDTETSNVEHTQRWITGEEYDCAVLVDRLDRLKMLYEPSNEYAMRMREAAARKEDDIVMESYFADAKAGKQGLTAAAFKAANIVAVNAVSSGSPTNTSLTVAKLRALRKLAKKRHVDLRTETLMLAVTADEIDELFDEVAVTSADYNAMKPLVDGEISKFMGILFVPHEDSNEATSIPRGTTSAANDTRRCPSWVMSGMHYGAWSEIQFVINNRADKNNIPQIHGQFMAGATRIEDDKVFRVDCLVP